MMIHSDSRGSECGYDGRFQTPFHSGAETTNYDVSSIIDFGLLLLPFLGFHPGPLQASR